MITGEPGTGKSRLLQEACRILDLQGMPVLYGACTSDFGLPFDPLVGPLRVLLSAVGSGELPLQDAPGMSAQMSEGLIRQLVAGGSADAAMTTLPAQALSAVVSVLSSAMSQGPLVLALEDLHWAGESVLRALRFVIERTEDLPLLILTSHRDSPPDDSPALAAYTMNLHRVRGVQHLQLEGLRTEEVSLYLTAMGAGTHDDVAEAARVLRDRTAGNPFLLGELWRDLSTRRGRDALDGVGDAVVPASVRALIAQRLAGLTVFERDTLSRGAVIGEAFAVEMVQQSARLDAQPGHTLKALSRARAVGLIEAVPGSVGEFRFPHSLAREAIIALIDHYELATMHAAVGDALERRIAGEPSLLPKLAYHLEQAVGLGLESRAARYLEQAAEYAVRRLAHSDAAKLFERSARSTSSGPERQRITLRAATFHRFAGELETAKALDESVARSARYLQACEAAVGFEESSWLGSDDGIRAQELLESALRDVPMDNADPWVVRARAAYARVLHMAGSAHAHRYASVAERLARASGDDRLLRDVLFHQLVLTINVSRSHGVAELIAQRELAAEVELLSDRLGDARPLLWTTQLQVYVAYVLGDASTFAATLPDLTRMVQLTRDTFFGCRMLDTVTSSRILRCDLDGAMSSHREALRQRDTMGLYEDRHNPSSLQSFIIRREFGGLEFAKAYLTERATQGDWGPGLVALYTELGMLDRARNNLRSVLAAEWQDIRNSSVWPFALSLLGDAAVELHDDLSARVLLEDAELLTGTNLMSAEMLTPTGSADRLVAGLRSVLGRPGVDEGFAAALDMDTRMGAPLHVATTHAQWAVALQRRGGAAAQLREHTDAARVLADQYGLVRVKRLLTGLAPVPRATPTPAPDGLTARELEVLRLLALGHSNREIAGRLFVSQNTAANHVRSILMKTRTANRTAAARYAVRTRLVDLSED